MPKWKSWTPPKLPEETTAEFSWGDRTVRYAADVYHGRPERNQPGRPWVEGALGVKL